jgi:anaphase-promoting complex subunit 11
MMNRPTALKIEIKRYRAAGYWRWDIEELGASKDPKQQQQRGATKATSSQSSTYVNKDEEEEEVVCGICHAQLDGTCPMCAIPGDDCPPVLGACSHTFHMHCIVKWLAPDPRNQDERRQHCPMCRAEWKFKGEKE